MWTSSRLCELTHYLNVSSYGTYSGTDEAGGGIQGKGKRTETITTSTHAHQNHQWWFEIRNAIQALIFTILFLKQVHENASAEQPARRQRWE